MAGTYVKLDMRKLQEIERLAPGRAAAVVQKLAQDCEADIKDNFSDTSPSAPNTPPGVDTGLLKSKVQAEPGDNDMTWLVNIGTDYAIHLEFGTEKMIARPFVLPSVHRIAHNMPAGLLKEVVEG